MTYITKHASHPRVSGALPHESPVYQQEALACPLVQERREEESGVTRIRTYAYLRHGTPVPEGAKVVSTFEGQTHGKYSVLIELPREKKDSAS